MDLKKTFPQQKKDLHPRNRHRDRYDFPALISTHPALKPFVSENKWGDESVDFADPDAVKTLNQALLRHYYGIAHWDIPAGYLCPPIPGRSDYIHYLADLLAQSNNGVIPGDKRVAVLDIGIGANCIYPIIGLKEYGWRFTGSEIDPVSLNAAKMIIAMNPTLKNSVRLRQQKRPDAILEGIISVTDIFDAVICNPPFHGSAEEALASTRRKLHKLGKADLSDNPVQNFGGKNNELWCEGGELTFVSMMARESVSKAGNCLWFTSLISKSTTLPPLYELLEGLGAADIRTINMAQGQKISRMIAWTFQNPQQQAEWAAKRWQ